MNGERTTATIGGSEERNGGIPEKGCCSVVNHGLSKSDIGFDVEVFSALANETRYEVLRQLGAADNEICVCELESALGVSQSAVSKALMRLFAAGLLERRKEGRWRYYTTTERTETLMTANDRIREDAA